MTKYEVLKMFEELFRQAGCQVDDDLEPVFLALIDVVDEELLLEGERGHWPLTDPTEDVDVPDPQKP